MYGRYSVSDWDGRQDGRTDVIAVASTRLALRAVARETLRKSTYTGWRTGGRHSNVPVCRVPLEPLPWPAPEPHRPRQTDASHHTVDTGRPAYTHKPWLTKSPAVARIAVRTGRQWPSRSSKVKDFLCHLKARVRFPIGDQ